MKRTIFILLILMFTQVSFGQTDTRELIASENIKSIRINTDEVYLLKITSTEFSEIKIKTHSEGEYFNEIQLQTRIKETELEILTKYPERLVNGFDKLSAHKVFSLEVELMVPEGLEIFITSNIASLETNGKFNSIYADLKQGYCKLKKFEGDAVINTYSGNILVETSSGIIEASSRNGTVQIPDYLPGRNPLRLTSIDGDIMVRKN